jgi:flavin-dependent dehydrogenase
MNNSYDLIVVGAGPAGLLAAKAAAEVGLSVALLEKKRDPNRLERACGQTLISMNEPYMGNICYYNEVNKRICFSQDGFSFKYEGPYLNLYSLVIVTNDGHVVHFGDNDLQRSKGKWGRIGCHIDKEALFTGLIGELKALGVDVIGGINVEKAINRDDHVVVEGGGRSFKASYVIGADGANSRVAASLGLNADRYYYCNFYALTHYVTNVNGLLPNQVVRLAALYLKDGAVRTYLKPRPVEGEYLVTMVTVDPRMDLKAATTHVFNEGISGKWLKKAKIYRSLSAAESCWSHVSNPVKGRVLITGDASVTQEAEMIGAMMCGWKAGNAVASAFIEDKVGSEVKGLADYVTWWRETVDKPYPAEAYMKGNVFPYVLTGDEDNNYVFGQLNETFRAVWNPYNSPTGSAMARAMAQAEKERPDIFQKLARRALPSTELLAPITRISKPILGE